MGAGLAAVVVVAAAGGADGRAAAAAAAAAADGARAARGGYDAAGAGVYPDVMLPTERNQRCRPLCRPPPSLGRHCAQCSHRRRRRRRYRCCSHCCAAGQHQMNA